MENEYTHEEIITAIEKGLEQIAANAFLSMKDYEDLVEKGHMVKKRRFEDDILFRAKYPEHPLNMDNRGKRIHGSDIVRDNAKQLKMPLEEKIIDHIHEALFDCCPAVRLSLAEVLLHIGSENSITSLEVLANCESESDMVLKAAKTALLNCRMASQDYVQQDDKLIILVSKRQDLIEALLDVADKANCKLYIPRGGFSELITWRSQVQIIDRWYMGEDSWNMFCEYLKQVNTHEEYPVKAPDGEVLFDEPCYDHSPTILVDNWMEKSMKHFAKPLKPKDLVYYIEGGPDDLVKELVYRITTNGSMDLKDISDTVNRNRMKLEGV